jgi:hypothetical protein
VRSAWRSLANVRHELEDPHVHRRGRWTGHLHLLIPSGKVSHFIWRDPGHILAYAGYGPEASEWRFQVFDDLPGKVEVVEGMPQSDGHCTYLPSHQWILSDSYPDRERRQHVYLIDISGVLKA